MEHYAFLYNIICYSIGGVGLLFAFLTAVIRGSRVDRRYAAFMASFTLILVCESAGRYIGNTGIGAGIVGSARSYVEFAGGALMIAVLPRFVHSLSAIPFEKTLNRIFALAGAFAYVFILFGLGGIAPLPAGITYVSLLIGVIVYAVVAGNLFGRKYPLLDYPTADVKRWHRIMDKVSVLTAAFIPLFIFMDFFPLPFLRNSRIALFRTFPLFYLLWNLIYIGHTLPLYLAPRPHSGGAGIWDFGRFDLSPREREVASLLLDGYAYREVAVRLSVSLATVKTHVNRIYEKTGAGNKMELARMLRFEPVSTELPTAPGSK